MGMPILDNFNYQGSKPLDGRTTYATIADMKNKPESVLYNGCTAYVEATEKYYTFNSNNTVDPNLGKWREFETGETYSDFTGATSGSAGSHGLVPAPSAGDDNKVLYGNGSWGNLPNVDLSNMIGDGDIYSTDEKLIGQWIDGKPLYQKSINCGAMPNNTVKSVAHNISNIDRAWVHSGYSYNPNSNAFNPLELPNDTLSGQWYTRVTKTNIEIATFTTRSDYSETYVTIRYTKTTDSPLASEERIAGLTASGDVIYKKHLSGLNASLNTNDWNTLCNIPDISCVIDAIGYYNNSGTGLVNTVILTEIEPYQDGTVKAQVVKPRTINELTIRYTKSS